MTGLELAIAAFALMLVAIFFRVPIGVAMGVTGFVGTWIVLGRPNAPLSLMKSLTYETFSSYSLSIVPLFLLMGQFATKSGMSAALFKAASDWLGHRRGGVAMAAVGACAGFGAVCGSSPYSQVRHARHPDSAFDHPGDLCHPGRTEYRQDVHRGVGAGHSGGTWLYGDGGHLLLVQARGGSRAGPGANG